MHLDLIHQRLNKLFCCLFITLIILPVYAAEEEWIYTVRPGDNLWNLSERHLNGTQYVRRLQQLNRLPVQ